jgi:pyridoxamine 5'-phosphate oxidase
LGGLRLGAARQIGYSGPSTKDRMSKQPIIPFSPSEEDYLQRVADAEPLPAITDADPIPLFVRWLEEALKKEPSDANAMTLATVDADGLPDARMVLLKEVDQRGFVFYTNLDSAKGRELAANPKACLLFHWKSLGRQVRVRGPVEPVSDAEADAYFASRARHSQIGAWASDQSRPLESRFALEKKVAQLGLKFGLGPVPRPPNWSGYRLKPQHIEFWREGPFRLHDRLHYSRAGEGWSTARLYP